MAKADDNRLAFGLTMIVFGVLFLLEKLDVLGKIPKGELLTDFRVLLLVAGIIFLIVKKEKKWGLILTGFGIVLNADFFFGWIKYFSPVTVPISLIVVGIVLIFRSKT